MPRKPKDPQAPRPKKPPFDFVLEELAAAKPYTKPLFGCTAVYVGEKIVFALRQKEEGTADNGVWIATTAEHHQSLRRELPRMKSIEVFGGGETGWQVLPSSAPDFEESVLKACAMVLHRDPRVGKVPKARRPKRKKSASK